jgi:methylase of polypeptide subunit release factors
MTDRELLELAAKAAGIEIEYRPGAFKNRQGSATKFDVVTWNGPYLKGSDDPWNPLTDDGDALRLAVKLKIAVDAWVSETCTVVFFHGGRGRIVERHYGDDPYAATRRAIVRAAAEIGRNMP